MLFIVNEMETRSKYVSTLKLTQAKFAAARGAPPWLYACLSFFPTISLTLSLCLSFFGSSHAEDEEEAAEETKKKGAEVLKRGKWQAPKTGWENRCICCWGGKLVGAATKKKNSEKRQKEKNTKMVKKMENQKLLATR